MLRSKYSMTKHINKLFYSWFGLGYSPFAAGTLGSLGAIPLCILINQTYAPWLKFFFILGFVSVAILSSATEQKTGRKRDPGYIVVDEVAGMLISTAFAMSTLQYLIAFILFRFFDITKPFPIYWLDRKSKNSKTAFLRGFYIVMDDVLAGIFSLLIYFIFIRFF